MAGLIVPESRYKITDYIVAAGLILRVMNYPFRKKIWLKNGDKF